jgi:energy-coupling factor transporter ATP-binding protein EcfA2
METRAALVAALAEHAGAVVLVSHDWHLVELVADRLWLVEGGTARPFEEAYRRHPIARDAAERQLELAPLRRQAREAKERAAGRVGPPDRRGGGGMVRRREGDRGGCRPLEADANYAPPLRGQRPHWRRDGTV